ncbi:MAG: hypothetical protein J2P46_02225 [Zavarzinella sp.]|nr:hypothetical protein [Zavarzinella sp.]
MAFLTPCPNCGVRLKSATRLPAGQRLTCPKCREKFITLAESVPFVRSKDRKGPFDLPDAVLLDEPDDTRPRVRERDEKDRPGSRRRDREPPKPKKPPSPVVLVGLILGVFALCLAVGVGLYLIFREAQKPAANDLLAHAPADAVALSGFDLDELSANEAFRRSLEQHPPPDLAELDRAGLRAADLSRALVARTANNGTACAVRFRAAPDRSKYLGPDLAGRSYAPFIGLAGTFRFGYFADRTTLVLAEKEPTIQDLRDKGAHVRLSVNLRDMVDRAHGPVWRATGRLSSPDLARGGLVEEGLMLRVGPSAGSAAWLEPNGGLARVCFELAFDKPGEAPFAAAVVRSSFQVQRGLTEFGPESGRDWVDSAEVTDVRRGYDEAMVTEGPLTLSARLTLPAGEALRAVGAVRH